MSIAAVSQMETIFVMWCTHFFGYCTIAPVPCTFSLPKKYGI